MRRTGSTAPSNKVLRVVRQIYPSTAEYFQVWLGSERVGAFERTDAGFVPFNCRKPLATMEEAAREVAYRRVRGLLKATALLSAALDKPISLDAVDPSAASMGTPSTRDVNSSSHSAVPDPQESR